MIYVYNDLELIVLRLQQWVTVLTSVGTVIRKIMILTDGLFVHRNNMLLTHAFTL